MIYKFKSKSGADVIMLQPQGDQMLSLLGRQPSAQGIVEAADLAGAIATLEQAVAADEAAARAADPAAPRREGISLRQRAWPLIELMRASQQAGHDIVWGV